MLSMLMVVIVLAKVSFIHSRASSEHQLPSQHILSIFTEDDMTPDFTEQLGSHDHTKDIQKRSDTGSVRKHERPHHVVKTNGTEKSVKNSIARHAPDNKKRSRLIVRQDEDVYDREDHVTQYLADHLINTDSEITSLQASELEEDRDNIEVKHDWFFAFLTGQEKAIDHEGIDTYRQNEED